MAGIWLDVPKISSFVLPVSELKNLLTLSVGRAAEK